MSSRSPFAGPAAELGWLFGLGMLASAAVALALAGQTGLLLALVASTLIAASFLDPRLGFLLLAAVPMLFREETWQLLYYPVSMGGTAGSTPTFYDQRLFGLSLALAVVAVLALRSAFASPRRAVASLGPFQLWLLVLLAADIGAELIGRLSTGVSGGVLGQWSQLALPIIAALLLPLWCVRRDIARAFDVLIVVASARLLWGLGRYATGGGDWHIEIGRRIPFWDSADGLLGAFVAVAGVATMLDRSASPLRRRVGLVLLVLGSTVVVLCLRRQALVALVIGVGVTMLLLRRRAVLLWTAVAAVLLVAAVTTADLVIVKDSVWATRAVSVVSVKGEHVSTNQWHMSDVKDGLLNIARSPILGYGYHSSPPRRTYELSGRDMSLEKIGLYHNMYLNTWFRMGILGLVALVGVLFLGLRDGYRHVLQSGDSRAAAVAAVITAMCVTGMAGSTLTTDRAPWFLFLGLSALALLRRDQQSPPQAP